MSLHLWLRYWTHEYLIHHVSLCRVGLMVYQWSRIFMLHNRAYVMEHVYETSVSPQNTPTKRFNILFIVSNNIPQFFRMGNNQCGEGPRRGVCFQMSVIGVDTC